MKKKKNCYFVVYVFGVSMVRIFAIVNQHFNNKFIKSFFVPEEKQQFRKIASYLIYMATIFNYRQLPKGTFRLTVTWVNVLQWNHIHSLEEAMLHCVCSILSREILIELLMM